MDNPTFKNDPLEYFSQLMDDFPNDTNNENLS